MISRAFLLSVLVALLLLAGCGGPEQSKPPENTTSQPAGPNLLLITLDTARADRFGCSGYQKAVTPNIDWLAGGGVLFEQAFTPVPLTVSSHASIFTGCYPPHHGVHTNDEKLLDEPNLCLAEMLKAREYYGRFLEAAPNDPQAAQIRSLLNML